MRMFGSKQRLLLTGLVCLSCVGFSLILAASSNVAPVQQKPSTSITLSSSMNPSRFGLLLTFTASVHAAPGKTVEGLVTFKDGKTVLGTGNVNRSGQATLSTPILSAGLHLISVSYREGQNQAEAASSILRQAIDRAPTVTSIHLPSSSAPGTGITLTASVFTKDPAPTAGPPMGSVIFKDGKTVLGTATINMFQQAVFSAPALSAGLHSLTASYQGNANFAGSTSSTFNLTVTK